MIVVSHVVHGDLVAATEAVTVIVAEAAVHGWMFVALVVVGVPVPALVPIAARSFNTVMEALALHVAVLVRRLIPGAILIEAWDGRSRCGVRAYAGHTRGQAERNCKR